MNDKTLTALRTEVARRWPHERLTGSHAEWLETLAHVLPKDASKALDRLSDAAGDMPTAAEISEAAKQVRTEGLWEAARKLEPLPATGIVPLTLKAKIRLNPIVHTFWNLTGLVGLRHRLRCPSCTAVGTWKPHGDVLARIKDGDRPVRRWLCKFCGRYEGPEGITRGWPRSATGVWVIEAPGFTDREPTPLERIAPTWPWRG